MRQATGLAIGTRMPFEWNEGGNQSNDSVTTTSTTSSSNKRNSKNRIISKQNRYKLDELAGEVKT